MPLEPHVEDIQTAHEQQLDEAKELTSAAAQSLKEGESRRSDNHRRGDPDVAIVQEAADWGADGF